MMRRGTFAICIGIAALVVVLLAIYAPILLSYEGQLPKDKIVLAYSDNLIVGQTTFNLVTNDSPQHIYINYALIPDKTKNGFISIMIPYKGSVTTLPENWQKKSTATGSTILYEIVTCKNGTNCTNTQGNIQFDIAGSIDSFRFPDHFIHLQFSRNMLNQEFLDLVNALRPNGTSIASGWEKIGIANAKITLDKEYDEPNTQPLSSLDTIPNPGGGDNVILNWEIKDDTPLFTANYNSHVDRFLSYFLQISIAVGTAVGVTMLMGGFQINQADDNQRRLETSQGELQANQNELNRIIGEQNDLIEQQQGILNRQDKLFKEKRNFISGHLIHRIDNLIQTCDHVTKLHELMEKEKDLVKKSNYKNGIGRRLDKTFEIINLDISVPDLIELFDIAISGQYDALIKKCGLSSQLFDLEEELPAIMKHFQEIKDIAIGLKASLEYMKTKNQDQPES